MYLWPLTFFLFLPFFVHAEAMILAKELYSQPRWEEAKAEDPLVRRVVLAQLNDLFGQLGPTEEEVPNGQNSKVSIKVGGAQAIKAYLKILRQRYGKELLFIGSGNFFSMAHDADADDKAFKFANSLEQDVFGLGVSDLHFLLQQRASTKNIPKLRPALLTSNILDLATGSPPRFFSSQETTIRTVNGVKVGLFSAIGNKVFASIPSEDMRGLYVEGMAKSILKHSKALRKKGAQIVVLLASVDINCGEFNGEDSWKNFAYMDPWRSGCSSTDDLVKIAGMLGPQLVDAILISNFRPDIVSQFIENIPVISSGDKGKYLGRMDLFYDLKNRRLMTEKTRIYPPIKLCHKFFSSAHDCVGQAPQTDLTKLEPAQFLGYEIKLEADDKKAGHQREISSRKN